MCIWILRSGAASTEVTQWNWHIGHILLQLSHFYTPTEKASAHILCNTAIAYLGKNGLTAYFTYISLVKLSIFFHALITDHSYFFVNLL